MKGTTRSLPLQAALSKRLRESDLSVNFDLSQRCQRKYFHTTKRSRLRREPGLAAARGARHWKAASTERRALPSPARRGAGAVAPGKTPPSILRGLARHLVAHHQRAPPGSRVAPPLQPCALADWAACPSLRAQPRPLPGGAQRLYGALGAVPAGGRRAALSRAARGGRQQLGPVL